MSDPKIHHEVIRVSTLPHGEQHGETVALVREEHRCTCLAHEDDWPLTEQSIHNSWCRIGDVLWVAVPEPLEEA